MQLAWYELREKCPNTKLFLVRISCIRTGYGGKDGPEITLHLGTFHAVMNLIPSVVTNKVISFALLNIVGNLV